MGDVNAIIRRLDDDWDVRQSEVYAENTPSRRGARKHLGELCGFEPTVGEFNLDQLRAIHDALTDD